MKEPEYNPQALANLKNLIGNEPLPGTMRTTNEKFDKSGGAESIRKIREVMGVKK
tara:strand:- start:17751 stop:17915 length:165 start_codon:yes stop_codon:yes gene_type:complete